jgi:hypothetical protein
MKETACNLRRPLHQEGFQNRTPSHKETMCIVVHSACGHARDKPELYLHIAHISMAESKILKVAQGLMVSMGCDVCFTAMCLQVLNLHSTITIDSRMHIDRTFVITKT